MLEAAALTDALFRRITGSASRGAYLVPGPAYRWAPQRTLYPGWDAHPSPESVVAFLKANNAKFKPKRLGGAGVTDEDLDSIR